MSTEAPGPGDVLAGRALVFLNNFPQSFLGGGEIYVLHLIRGARERGMRVAVLAMPGSAMATEARIAGADVLEVDLMAGGLWVASRRVRPLLADLGADVVHGTGYYTNLLARASSRRAGASVVNSVLCEPASVLKTRPGLAGRAMQGVRSWVDNATARGADAIIANSRAVERGLIEQGIRAPDIRVIHHGIDPDAVRGQARSGPVPDGLSATPAGVVKVGTVGRLEPVKGLDFLLDAALTLSERTDLRFFIGGAGSEKSRLEARVASDPRLRESVSLLGFVENAAAFISALDICCLPSLSEGLPTTLLEALALDVPVVSTAVGGAPEVVEDRVTGLLVPPGDPSALARAIGELADDRDLARRTAGAGRRKVDAEFTVARMVDQTMAVYTELLEKRRG